MYEILLFLAGFTTAFALLYLIILTHDLYIKWMQKIDEEEEKTITTKRTCKDCKFYFSDYDGVHDYCTLLATDNDIEDINAICTKFIEVEIQ